MSFCGGAISLGGSTSLPQDIASRITEFTENTEATE